ncbi:head fiber protein [Alkalibacterium sp. MB6]|uniref:head fiber protein n=1 Tax=Alkalibacterium sp. MB6 TaxID=2081965 RepID=UPI0013797E90|nr:head fiber protein [Alkalibacterium sp. MB6]
MTYNTKNYTEQGGEKTIIGGEMAVTAEGKVTFDGTELKPAALQAESTATEVAELVTDFNDLLLKLKTAGLMESE